MDNEIKNIRLKFNCPANWNSMQTVDGGKFCDHCQKKVYDFTDARQELFQRILAENSGNICGRYKAEQMAPVPFKLPVWKKWLSAAMVLIGVNIFYNKAEAQDSKIKKNDVSAPLHEAYLLGMSIQAEPSFPGGNDRFMKFLSQNIRYTKGMKNGRVFASFIVDKDGSLLDIKIVRGISELNDDEVIRVLKLSPKWKPGIENGKPVAVTYTIPVNFESTAK